jgi:peptide/nickel transport system substrate-binding protein
MHETTDRETGAGLSRRAVLKAGGALLATAAVAACGGGGGSAARPAKPVKGGHMVEGYLYDVSTLNPVLATGRTTNLAINSMLFDGLLTYSPKGEILPLLATSVPKGSADHLTYAFDLNPNARWTDGTPVTADDVVFTYRLHSAPEYHDVNSTIRSTLETYLAKVEAAGPRRVVFTLKKPYAPFITSFCWYGILPKKVFDGMTGMQINTAGANSNPVVSCGQFKFKSWQKGDAVTLVRNDSYYRGAPHLDTFVFRYISNNNVLAQQLRTGEVDFGFVLPSLMSSFQGERSVRIYSFPQPQLAFCFFQMDPSKPGYRIFGDKSVRQALNHASDRAALVKDVYFGQGVPGHSMLLPPSSWAYDATPEPSYGYDPKKAARLLDDAGWKVGQDGVRAKAGQPLRFSVMVGDDKTWQSDLQILQEAWRKLGIQADIKTQQTAQVSAEVATGRNFDMLMTEFGFTAVDPDPSGSISTASAASGGLNGSTYKNPKVDDLLNQGVTETDQARRKAIYSKLQDVVSADAPRLPLVSPNAIYGINQRVQGLQAGLGPYTRYTRPFMKDLWVSSGGG